MALREAAKAAAAGEIPVGCVIVSASGEVLARAHNQVEKRANSTLHAEMVAMGRAMKKVGEKYLMGSTIYITLEPCPMCTAAISWAKVGRIVYGAKEDKNGGLFVLEHARHFFKPKVVGGICAEESSEMLKEFFKSIRGKNSSFRA